MSSLDLSWAVRGVDSMLRRHQGIEEFTVDPACLFRISLAPARRAVLLSDGAAIRPGDPVVAIHYWNEHMPPLPARGMTAAWAATFKNGVRHSLALIADLFVEEQRFRDAAALYGEPAFATTSGSDASIRISHHLGFDVIDDESRHGAIHAWFDSVLIWFLMRTFNPVSVRGRGLAHGRLKIWMSRQKLIARYAGRAKVRL